MGKGGGGRKKKGPKFLPDGTPLTNKAKKQVSREERAAQRAKEAKKLMEEASKKAKAEADRTKNKKKKAGGGSKKGSKKAAAEEPPVLVGGPRKQVRQCFTSQFGAGVVFALYGGAVGWLHACWRWHAGGGMLWRSVLCVFVATCGVWFSVPPLFQSRDGVCCAFVVIMWARRSI